MADIAFLVFKGSMKQGKRKRDDFDGQDNIGAYVIKDVLERAGFEVGFCSPESAHLYKVVLISVTSLYDCINFFQSVARLTTWRKDRRSFVSVIGGAGLQNVAPIRHHIDYAVFGRAENFIAEVITTILAGKDVDHPSVMPLREEIRDVTYAQSEVVYPYEVKVGTGFFKETVSGCPMKCGFCHYTYARKWLGGQASEYVRDGTYQSDEPGGVYKESMKANRSGSGAEGLFKQSVGMLAENPQSRIITGLDGLSERLRYAMRKRISNDKVVEIFEEASKVSQIDPAFYKLYMVGSYPTENGDDYDDFIETMTRPLATKARVHVTVHLTPFQASPLSPAAWLPVTFDTHWRERVAGARIATKGLYLAWWSRYIETEWTHLRSMIVARATAESDELINQIAFNKKLNSLGARDALEAVAARYDLAQYGREYYTWEEIPTWYLHSYQSDETMLRAARALKENLGMAEPEPPAGVERKGVYEKVEREEPPMRHPARAEIALEF